MGIEIVQVCAQPFDKKTQKFKSLTGETVRLAFTTGHVFMVGDDFVDIPAGPNGDFWKKAFSAGCISEEALTRALDRQKSGKPSAMLGDNTEKPDLSNLTADQRRVIAKEKIALMYATKDLAHFTASDIPKADKLSELCGFTVSAFERDDWTMEYMAEDEARQKLAESGGASAE